MSSSRRAAMPFWRASLLLMAGTLLLVMTPASALYVVGKRAFQSSSYSASTGAYKAVDGVAASCPMTKKERHPWLRVDLGGLYCIEAITIRNRADCCSDRLVGATVRAGTSWDVTANGACGSPVTAAQAETPGGWLRMRCDRPTVARYVSVDIDLTSAGRTQYLTVCEMTVTESSSPECPLPNAANASSFIDATCYTPTPLVEPTQDDNVFLGTYLGRRDSTDAVSFDRYSATGQDGRPGLPSGSFQVDHPAQSVDASLLYMPPAGRLNRLGVFSCVARKGALTTTVPIVILSNENGIHLRPVARTKTANLGETVTLEVRAVSPPSTEYRWRVNAGNFIAEANGRLTHRIRNVCVGHAGIYECHVNQERPKMKHAIMRLIVRGCPSGQWDPESSCAKECPTCYNGGMCDDISGVCICPPGFRGRFCEEVLGSAIFGQDGSHHCDGWGDPHGNGCQGKLFCLPDPYGCSCAAGYQGLDCMEECEEGTYGADCKQTCHCALNVTCLPDTGECQGECGSTYTGVNCQHTACPVGFFGHNCSSVCHCALSDTCHYDTGKCDGSCAQTYIGENCQQQAFTGVQDLAAIPDPSNPGHMALSWRPDSASFYIIDYVLLNRGRCEPVPSPASLRAVVPGRVPGQSTSFTVQGLEPASAYVFYVQSHYGIYGLSTQESFVLAHTAPAQNPREVRELQAHGDALPGEISVSWRPVQCASVYYLTFDLVQNGDCPVSPPRPRRTFSTGEPSLRRPGFQPYSWYTVSVYADVDGVNGTESAIEVTTAPAAPEPPGGLSLVSATATTLHFTWSALPCVDAHGRLEGYRYSLRDATTRDVVASGYTAETAAGFAALPPCQSFEFAVAAVAAGLQSPLSHWLVSKTAPAEPGPVLAPTIVNSSQSEIRLSWQRPGLNGCPIAEYGIRYERLAGDSCPTTAGPPVRPHRPPVSSTVPADVTSTTLTALMPGSKYQIFLRAVNSAGAGQEISLLGSTDAAAPADPPRDVMLLSVEDEQSLGFAWSRPPCGGALSQFTYRLLQVAGPAAAEAGRHQSLVSAGNTTREWVVIGGLDAGVTYGFRVAAYSGSGVGPYTDIISSTVMPQPESKTEGSVPSVVSSTGPEAPTAQPPVTNPARQLHGEAPPADPAGASSAIAAVVFVCAAVLLAGLATVTLRRSDRCRRRSPFSGHVRWMGTAEESTAEADVYSIG